MPCKLMLIARSMPNPPVVSKPGSRKRKSSEETPPMTISRPELQIDGSDREFRAFVHGIDQDPARQNMLRAFQTIALDMNARIIGEGLDTLEELRTLGDLGIQFGQGWLFGKPAPLRAGD